MPDKHTPSFSPQIAILGAGTMGMQIAQLYAQVDIHVLIFDIDKDGENLAQKAMDTAIKKSMAQEKITQIPTYWQNIQTASYQEVATIQQCSWVIEAVSENLDIKKSVYQKILPHIAPHALLSSNTSGLLLGTLVQFCPHPYFCGLHFFNPPKTLPLVECITPNNQAMTPELEQKIAFWLDKTQRHMVRAKDAPNFIANHIGFFSWLVHVHVAQVLGLNMPQVDALTGHLMGRPKSGTYRLADVVGLDIVAAIVESFQVYHHPKYAHFYRMPDVLTGLLARGQLGQKTGAGFYQKTAQGIAAWCNQTHAYQDIALLNSSIDGGTHAILSSDDTWPNKLEALSKSTHPHAQFVRQTQQILHDYVRDYGASMAFDDDAITQAMRHGFAWEMV